MSLNLFHTTQAGQVQPEVKATRRLWSLKNRLDRAGHARESDGRRRMRVEALSSLPDSARGGKMVVVLRRQS